MRADTQETQRTEVQLGQQFLPVYLGRRVHSVCVCVEKVSLKNGSIISMQPRPAADQAQPAPPQQAAQRHVSCRPHDSGGGRSVKSAEGHKGSLTFLTSAAL